MPVLRRHPLWLIAAAGLAIRLFLAFHWFGNGDILTFAFVGDRTLEHPLHTYAGNVGGIFWPYPPAYLLWLVAALKLAGATGLAFHGVVQILPILADLALATLVHLYLGWRGAGERARLAGFALVMLGPVFIAISGYHGQIDPVAILPAVLALIVWERRPPGRRAIEAGLLIGLGAVIKTVPFLMLLPLLIAARSRVEGVKLLGAASAVVAVVCLPFFLAEPQGFREGLSYAGVPGRGGLSVILDPGFAVDRRLSSDLATTGAPNQLADWLSNASGPITVFVLLALGAFLLRYRPALIDSVVLLWLAIFVFNPNFLPQYLVWALPFFLMAGYLAETALLQVAVIPMLLITYLSSSVYGRPGAVLYAVVAICLWAFWASALFTLGRRVIRARKLHPEGVQPPLVPLDRRLGSAPAPPAPAGS